MGLYNYIKSPVNTGFRELHDTKLSWRGVRDYIRTGIKQKTNKTISLYQGYAPLPTYIRRGHKNQQYNNQVNIQEQEVGHVSF